MCGIAGLWGDDAREAAASERAVARMLDAMAHRGPDGRGTLAYAGGAAGMVRLALVDLSERGQQPIWSPDRRVTILFNGEVYNHRELRAPLEAGGYPFRSTTDTEVVLAEYLERGIAFLERLRGMFALAIFDWRDSGIDGPPALLLARDPFGIKPLFVASPRGPGGPLLFSSEVRALLASGRVAAEPSPTGIRDFLVRGCVEQPGAVIRGVSMLEPGWWELRKPGRPVERGRFWRIPSPAPRVETLADAAARLRDVLEESVRLHALADAKVGAFLSGGIDSTGIVALMRHHVPELRTYTLRFPDLSVAGEATEAEAAARSLGTVHTTVDVRAEDVAAALPAFGRDIDEPSIDGLNTWLVSRAAARDVKGVLSGLGGDEWFAGYPSARRMAFRRSTRRGRAIAAAGRLASAFAPHAPDGRFGVALRNLAARRSPIATWLQPRTTFSPEHASRLLGLEDARVDEEARYERHLDERQPGWRSESPVGLACLLDVGVFMQSQLLRDSDATSMAHSLELRVPFVDVAVASASRTIADEHKLRSDGGTGLAYAASGSKRVLIEALRDLLPRDIADRPKRGFALPFHEWLAHPSVRSIAAETTAPETAARRGLLDPELVVPVHTSLRTGDRRLLYPGVWTLMVLELWCRGVLDAVP